MIKIAVSASRKYNVIMDRGALGRAGELFADAGIFSGSVKAAVLPDPELSLRGPGACKVAPPAIHLRKPQKLQLRRTAPESRLRLRCCRRYPGHIRPAQKALHRYRQKCRSPLRHRGRRALEIAHRCGL